MSSFSLHNNAVTRYVAHHPFEVGTGALGVALIAVGAVGLYFLLAKGAPAPFPHDVSLILASGGLGGGTLLGIASLTSGAIKGCSKPKPEESEKPKTKVSEKVKPKTKESEKVKPEAGKEEEKFKTEETILFPNYTKPFPAEMLKLVLALLSRNDRQNLKLVSKLMYSQVTEHWGRMDSNILEREETMYGLTWKEQFKTDWKEVLSGEIFRKTITPTIEDLAPDIVGVFYSKSLDERVTIRKATDKNTLSVRGFEFSLWNTNPTSYYIRGNTLAYLASQEFCSVVDLSTGHEKYTIKASRVSNICKFTCVFSYEATVYVGTNESTVLGFQYKASEGVERKRLIKVENNYRNKPIGAIHVDNKGIIAAVDTDELYAYSHDSDILPKHKGVTSSQTFENGLVVDGHNLFYQTYSPQPGLYNIYRNPRSLDGTSDTFIRDAQLGTTQGTALYTFSKNTVSVTNASSYSAKTLAQIDVGHAIHSIDVLDATLYVLTKDNKLFTYKATA